MQSHKLFIALFLMHSILVGWLSAASVTASVNTQNVIKGNSIQLSIRATGGSAAFPNIRQIDGIGVTDSGISTSTSMRITSNGMEKESATIKSYTFVPEHDMIIPSYQVRVGNETLKTKPISIKVTQSQAPTMSTNDAYSFVMKSSKHKVVVGESFIVTLYLTMSQRLGVQQVSEYVEPSSSEFFFKDLGEQKQYKKGNVNVIEKQYSVTTKKEGNFTISSASAKLGVTDRSRQDLFGRYGIRWVDIRSNTLNIEVLSPETETDLVGVFHINSKIDRQKVKANKPVNLTVTIKGKGNLEDFEFPKYEIDGVTIYDDEAKIESHIEGGELVSTYSKNFAFISEEDFTIPKRAISDYNTYTHEVETLEIPAYEVTIEQRRAVNSMVSQNTIPTKVVEKNITTTNQKVITKEVMPWWMLIVAFFAGMLVIYSGRFILELFKAKEKPYKESEALKVLYAHISEDKAIEEMVHKLYARKNGDKSVEIDKKELKEMVNRFR